MNIEIECNSPPDFCALMDFNNMDMEMNSHKNDDMARLHPTPINRERIVPVDKVALNATSWNFDAKSIEYLKGLSVETSSMNSSVFPRSEGAIPVVSDSSMDGSNGSNAFRQSQVDLWKLRYTELLDFFKKFGHCLVPLRFPQNSSLSHWVKRQRYQYRVKTEGKHSTLNDDRQAALEALGFVWDSHAASWEERWNELRDFRDTFGHTNVPKTFKANPQLAIWVKSQRRHYRLHCQGKASAMSSQRVEKLLSLGFLFNPRSQKRDFDSMQYQALF